MNNQKTLEKMQKMKLHGMTRAFQTILENGGIDKNFTTDELIAHLIDVEYDERYNRKLTRLLKTANFRYQAAFEEINFYQSRNLDKNQILRFSDSDWITKKQSIIVTGPTGIGKSFLISAFGHQACVHGYKTAYFNCSKLFSLLKISKADESYVKQIDNIEKKDVLILDDFGIKFLDTTDRLSLLEIIEDRHGRKSTIIASQVPLTKWHEIIGDATIADAICDRLIHSSEKIQMEGPSMRKILSKKS